MWSSRISIDDGRCRKKADPHTAQLQSAPEWSKPSSISVLQSTANDILTFLGAATGLSKSTLAPAFAGLLAIRRPAPMISADHVIGWYVHPFNGRPIIGHSGSGGGFGATALYDPAAQVGVVLLANAESLWEDVAGHILRPSLPLAPKKAGAAIADAVLDAHTGRYIDATGAA